jgi:hypothetical protein
MRLIIATNSTVVGVAAKNALTAFLEAKGWSVWHWYEDLWLMDNVPPAINLSALREEIQRAIPTLYQVLVMSAEGQINHAGMVPTPSAAWFDEHWNRR